MVIEIRGDPKGINRTLGSWGLHEQWFYYGDNYIVLRTADDKLARFIHTTIW
jgi:hypothetical protein